MVAWLLLFALVSTPCLDSAPPKAVHEYKVKAVFMYNFGKFVEWPKKSFKNTPDLFVVGVVGDDEFYTFLQGAVKGGKVRGRGFVVKKFDSVKSITDCHMLFVGRSVSANWSQIRKALVGKPTLTVSDLPRFAEKGGAVGFVSKGKKVGLEFNMEAASAAGVKLSSKLLRVGEVKVEARKKLDSNKTKSEASQ